MGGVTIDVTQRLPIGGLLADGTRVPPVGYIEPGVQHMNGSLAQWYARSRRDGTDYDRMLRQRCLIGAMVQQATPVNVLKHFQELSSATKKLAETDIPRSVLPDLISLGDKMHGGSSIRSRRRRSWPVRAGCPPGGRPAAGSRRTCRPARG